MAEITSQKRVRAVFQHRRSAARDYYVATGLSLEFAELPMEVARAAAHFNASAPAVNGGQRVLRLEHFAWVSRLILRRKVRGVGPMTLRWIEDMLAERGLEMLP